MENPVCRRKASGFVRGGEVRWFTLVAKLDLYRLNNDNILSAQPEDLLRNRECACTLFSSNIQ